MLEIIFGWSKASKWDCPDDINEAISSLIYASAWFGEIPELLKLRMLFGKHYGQKFVLANLELYPGNHVNCQIKEKLSMTSISDEVKQNLIKEIAKDCRLQLQPLAIEWRRRSEMLQNQVSKSSDEEALDRDIHIDYASTKQSQAQGSSADNFKDSMPNGKELLNESFSFSMHSDSPCSRSSTSGKEDHIVRLNSAKRLTIIRSRKESEEMVTSSSSEFSYQFMEEKIVYLDDVMEIQSSVTKDGISQDQRIFIFQSSILPKKEKLCSISTTRKRGKTLTKRLRKRAPPLYCQNAMGIECLAYYNSKCHRKRQKKIDLLRSQRLIQCSLEHPCYDCTSNGDDDHDHDDQMGMRKKTFIRQKQRTRRYQNDAQQPEEHVIDDYRRSSSSQSQLHSHSSSKSSTSSHVHPKLPDYDELEAKFTALKKAYMQNKNRTWNIK
ncbi:Vacuolar protein sorting-associated protein Ist1 [Dillenia turbinata]|uniref:Vacuolar protein sorting-associated protein Ist1 n=1 Tax=Dillenia turbinata TaxID=194707 RepID=A0AAN8YXR1_9MAGN